MSRRNGIAGTVVGAFALAISTQASALTIYGVTTANNLIRFESATPGTLASSVAITGLAVGDAIVGIDFRPANGALFGLGSGSRLYQIDPVTGGATQVGSSGAFSLGGNRFGFDFNPLPDRIRVTSNSDQNLRLNPNNGALGSTDGGLAYAPGDANAGANPNIVGAGYTNSFAPSPRATPGTTLYGIDSELDILVTQNPPNDGILNTVGALGVDTGDRVGFDIFAPGNLAFASLTDDTSGYSSLYSIDLMTGAATLIGGIGNGETLNGIAVATVPVPGSVALMAAGMVGLYAASRRRKGAAVSADPGAPGTRDDT